MTKAKELKILSYEQKSENISFLKKLKRKKPKDLDERFLFWHNKVFSEIDCLDCANCCKSISPVINDKDIQRIAAYLRMKPSIFVENYLHLDDEEDYVFNNTPCPFLMPDNYCSIYEQRPKACREYPHTDRRRMYQLLDLCLKNTEVCPAVYHILLKLRSEYS
jgi:Fe-S-cluster containining protein